MRFNSRTPSAFSSAWTFSPTASVETFRRRAAAVNPPSRRRSLRRPLEEEIEPMKDSVPERIERTMSHRDGVPFMKGTPVFPRCRFSNVMQLPCHIGVKSAAQASLGFGRFRVLLRQRQLLADELPVELGTRAFDLLL